MNLTAAIQPTHYITAIILLLAGCLVQAIGVVLEIKPRVAMMSAEGFGHATLPDGTTKTLES